MGYTHYWRPATKLPNFAEFQADVDKIIKAVAADGIKICGPMGNGEPVVSAETVAFNGDETSGDDHESFVVEADNNESFAFCKTAQKPYDLAVTAALIAAKKHFGVLIKVSSDGDDDEWAPARKLCQSVLGYGNESEMTEDGYRLTSV